MRTRKISTVSLAVISISRDTLLTKPFTDRCGVFTYGNHYCCRDNPAPLENCHWVGEGDCADNTCSSTDVTLLVNDQDDDGNSCSCKPSAIADFLEMKSLIRGDY